jgi:hypothetical protein
LGERYISHIEDVPQKPSGCCTAYKPTTRAHNQLKSKLGSVKIFLPKQLEYLLVTKHRDQVYAINSKNGHQYHASEMLMPSTKPGTNLLAQTWHKSHTVSVENQKSICVKIRMIILSTIMGSVHAAWLLLAIAAAEGCPLWKTDTIQATSLPMLPVWKHGH